MAVNILQILRKTETKDSTENIFFLLFNILFIHKIFGKPIL